MFVCIILAVERFPVSEHERELNTNSIERTRGSTSATNTNHNREVIFALPSLRLHFKTEHLQGVSTPDLASTDKPSVECSFITEFEDHIFVTVDADAFFFLHDLITSYLKEKEKMVSRNGHFFHSTLNTYFIFSQYNKIFDHHHRIHQPHQLLLMVKNRIWQMVQQHRVQIQRIMDLM